MVGLPLNTLLQAGLISIAVALGAVSLALMLEWIQERNRQRKVVEQLRNFDQSLTDSGNSVFRGVAGNASQWAQAMAARTPAFGDLQLLLQQAGASWTMEAFLLFSVGLAVAFGMGALLVSRLSVVGMLAAAFGGCLPYLVIRRRREKRYYRFESGLPEAIDLLGRAIRAGHPLSSGFQMVADETQEPISSEFRRTFEEQRFGLPFDDAITAMADRITLVDVRILITAIMIQRVVGGNLAEVLDNLSSVIRARFTIRRQLRTYTAQGRISGYVLAVLPIAVGTIIFLLNPEYMQLLFTNGIGRFMLVVAGVMQLIGFLWIRKIVNIEI
ncbi:MAG: type II secretion system F family protein [Pseudonocardiales bacterium]|nr:type II secretion system F family protein [Pseudonocardiales bacterium]